MPRGAKGKKIKLEENESGSLANEEPQESESTPIESSPEAENSTNAEEGEIRCVCGKNTDKGLMIQCETCLVWQHSDCMGISSANEIPASYKCELCEPRSVRCICDNTKNRLGKIVRCSQCAKYQHFRCLNAMAKRSLLKAVPFLCPYCATDESPPNSPSFLPSRRELPPNQKKLFDFVSSQTLREHLESDMLSGNLPFDELLKKYVLLFSDNNWNDLVGEQQVDLKQLTRGLGIICHIPSPTMLLDRLNDLIASFTADSWEAIFYSSLSDQIVSLEEISENEGDSVLNLENLPASLATTLQDPENIARFLSAPRHLLKTKRMEDQTIGLVCEDSLSAGDLIGEFLGVVKPISELQNIQKDRGFVLWLHELGLAIDARSRGNLTRYMQRSCHPNVEIRPLLIDGKLRVGMYAMVDLVPESLLTISFDFPWQAYAFKIRCACQSVDCVLEKMYQVRCRGLEAFLQFLDSEKNKPIEPEKPKERKKRRSSKNLVSEIPFQSPPPEKMTREERKMEAVLRSIERMERENFPDKPDFIPDSPLHKPTIDPSPVKVRKKPGPKPKPKPLKPTKTKPFRSETPSPDPPSSPSESESSSLPSPEEDNFQTFSAKAKFGKKAFLKEFQEEKKQDPILPLKKKVLEIHSSSNSSPNLSKPLNSSPNSSKFLNSNYSSSSSNYSSSSSTSSFSTSSFSTSSSSGNLKKKIISSYQEVSSPLYSSQSQPYNRPDNPLYNPESRSDSSIPPPPVLSNTNNSTSSLPPPPIYSSTSSSSTSSSSSGPPLYVRPEPSLPPYATPVQPVFPPSFRPVESGTTPISPNFTASPPSFVRAESKSNDAPLDDPLSPRSGFNQRGQYRGNFNQRGNFSNRGFGDQKRFSNDRTFDRPDDPNRPPYPDRNYPSQDRSNYGSQTRSPPYQDRNYPSQDRSNYGNQPRSPPYQDRNYPNQDRPNSDDKNRSFSQNRQDHRFSDSDRPRNNSSYPDRYSRPSSFTDSPPNQTNQTNQTNNNTKREVKPDVPQKNFTNPNRPAQGNNFRGSNFSHNNRGGGSFSRDGPRDRPSYEK